LRHAPDRVGDDRDRDDLQPMQPGGVRQVAEPSDAVAERNHRQRRWHREAEPGGERARQTGAQDADRDADLAARWAGQKLAQRDDVGERRLVEPSAARDKLGAEIAEMRDRSAK